MDLRSALTRLGIATAGGALVALAAASPVLADEGWETDSGSGHGQDWSHENQGGYENQGGHESQGGHENQGGYENQGGHDRLYTGRINARGGLTLRDAPTRGSAVVRVEPHGAIVHIFCKTQGEKVGHNNLWYLLTDGTWAWGAAEYIDNVGPAPRWC
ncbi:SH3 domain-containing protein [Streptomyces sp. NPDC059785]|uniref:SH3 domain-containing protein n=1 Tax=unclassified Streptomyces TaxID=2593676 RepID=UPI0036694244